MTIKVELGFTPLGASGPFFELDDPVKGLLDSTSYVLGGEILSDVSAFVKNVSISRGKSRELDRFRAGSASVTFNNETRVFDPAYTLSPYYGQIQPKRRLRITADDLVQFDGTVDDWDIQYNSGEYSTAVANSTDAIQNFANLSINDYTPTEQLSGARVNAVLDSIGWSATSRDIDLGSQTLVADAVDDGTNSFEYLQTIAQSEPGDLFISRNGSVKFVDRYSQITADTPAFSDDGVEIPYTTIQANVGSELLYNNITVTSSAGTAIATSPESVQVFGEIDYSLQSLVSSTEALQNLADFLLERYKDPQYRIDGITVALNSLSDVNKAKVLGLDLGDVIIVTFTPSGIPPAIVAFAKVIRISQSHNPITQIVTLGLEALTGAVMVLDNAEFGKLDAGYFLSGPYNAWTFNDAIYGRLSAGMAVS
tara:strand:- start:2228 stop:3499 length:1272 start_codon:yes stop_codon:yes gene_type:complete